MAARKKKSAAAGAKKKSSARAAAAPKKGAEAGRAPAKASPSKRPTSAKARAAARDALIAAAVADTRSVAQLWRVIETVMAARHPPST